MYVNDISGLSTSLKGYLSKNPFDSDLEYIKSAIEDSNYTIKANQQRIQQLITEMDTTKINLNIEKQKLIINEKRSSVISKAFLEASLNTDSDYLNVESMSRFFEKLNCRFLRLEINSDGERAYLYFVRENSFINALPVPPLLICMEYRKTKGKLTIKSVNTYAVIGTNSYIHPHISSGGSTQSICLGNFIDVLNDNNYSCMLDGYQDQVLLLNNLLHTYNPDSPYRTIDSIIGDISKGIYLHTDLQVFFDSSQYVFATEEAKIDSVHLHKLIGYDSCKTYIENCSSIKLRTIADDLLARIEMLEHDQSDSEMYDEMYDEMLGLYNSFVKLFPMINWSEVDSYSRESESDDGDEMYYDLDEDNFNDLKNEWARELRTWIDESCGDIDCLTLNKIPDLELLFGLREEVINVPF